MHIKGKSTGVTLLFVLLHRGLRRENIEDPNYFIIRCDVGNIIFL